MSRATSLPLLAPSLVALLAGCATPAGSPPADLAREYEHAIRDSAARTPASSVPLRAIPREQTVVWRYADPDGSEHQTANCSVAALTVTVDGRTLRTAHGGAGEPLGVRVVRTEPSRVLPRAGRLTP